MAAEIPPPLSPEEERVILRKGTEAPFTGKYYLHSGAGTYSCRKCGAPLYRSADKFDSGCGWPSFDDSIPGAVERVPDADGERVEVRCARCGAHLGHVFEGERLTPKDTRHCVNSVSMTFTPAEETHPGALSRIAFGAGCFWCSEAAFSRLKGVSKATPGYAGGKTENPSYSDVCTGDTGHAEVVLVEFDPTIIPLAKLLEVFFSIHDPTSGNRQGNDVGSQYRSAIFYTSEAQKQEIPSFIEGIRPAYSKPITTEVAELKAFYPAEPGHRRYYENNRLNPYCMLVIPPKLSKAKGKAGEYWKE